MAEMVNNIDIFDNFYKNKTILVTGHTGFKGSWLSVWLNELGANVIGYSLESNNVKNNFDKADLKNKIKSIIGDIRDEKKLNDVFEKNEIEIIFHLAAQPLVRESYKSPKETYDINVMGSLNILECARKSKFVKSIIMITTDKCYLNKEQIWGYREEDPMGGYDPYSSSKACCEILISSYRDSFFNIKDYNIHQKLIATVRAGNVIGGGDFSKDRIIPDCIKAIEKNEIIELRNPKAIRPWQLVLEPLYGYMKLAKKLYLGNTKFAGAWNFGPSYDLQIEVYKIVDKLISHMKKGKWNNTKMKNDLHEANLLSLDCTKANLILNWKTILSIDQTLEFVADWYKNSDEDIYKFDINQIKKYCDILRGNF